MTWWLWEVFSWSCFFVDFIGRMRGVHRIGAVARWIGSVPGANGAAELWKGASQDGFGSLLGSFGALRQLFGASR